MSNDRYPPDHACVRPSPIAESCRTLRHEKQYVKSPCRSVKEYKVFTRYLLESRDTKICCVFLGRASDGENELWLLAIAFEPIRHLEP